MKLICKVYDKMEMKCWSLIINIVWKLKLRLLGSSRSPAVKGKPAKDYVDGIRCITDKVLISGNPSLVDSIDNLKTETIDIENFNASITKLPM